MRAAVRFGPLDERDFRLLWLGQATSAFGSGLVPVALAFAVVDLTDSASALGVVLAAGLVARVVFLLVGGVVADRLPRQRVMLTADLLRTGSQGTVAVLLLAGDDRARAPDRVGRSHPAGERSDEPVTELCVGCRACARRADRRRPGAGM